MKRVSISSAPAAIGTYSQATVIDNMIFTSGQIAINPKTNTIVDSSFRDETIQVLNNIESILKSEGSSLGNVIKFTVFLIDLNNFSILNEVFSERLSKNNYPSRSVVEVSFLPKGVNLEIEAIAKI